MPRMCKEGWTEEGVRAKLARRSQNTSGDTFIGTNRFCWQLNHGCSLLTISSPSLDQIWKRSWPFTADQHFTRSGPDVDLFMTHG